MTPTTTTTTRPRSHDRKRIKHSTSMPIQDSYRRSSGFRYSSINNSGSSLNSILEVDHHDRREEEAPFTSSSRLSRSSSSPLHSITFVSSMNHNHIDTKMAPTTTTTRPRSHDQKRIKHSTSMPIQDSHRRSSGFRYSCINNSGSSLNSILEVDQDQDRREEATTTPSSRLSRSSSTPLPFTVTQSPTQSPTTTVIAHTDFWHSTRTMKKTQTCTSLNGLLDIVSMENDDDDDDDDEEEEIDEDFD
eukprot:CAMPEP_0170781324 /NCGR_PEP_ID=MMETSP0733-20121128/14128_1 /TAXON_ID=186038 /ORGANISM="Fragilariopsis kerguelensis, Strain L26-C5" /LENGTH=245 /DNA_ID=CAMNT_0011125335 /DNA_START=87 /DNA_END=821 /DNA_ORIENTATION=-